MSIFLAIPQKVQIAKFGKYFPTWWLNKKVYILDSDPGSGSGFGFFTLIGKMHRILDPGYGSAALSRHLKNSSNPVAESSESESESEYEKKKKRKKKKRARTPKSESRSPVSSERSRSRYNTLLTSASITSELRIKGTVSWDRFQKFWQNFKELDLIDMVSLVWLYCSTIPVGRGGGGNFLV